MSKNNIVLNDWVADYAKMISTETFKLINTLGHQKNASRLITTKFLQFFIEETLKDVLEEYKSRKDITVEQAYLFTKENLNDIKTNIQVEIAKGFEAAFSKFAKKDIEYYCIIKPMPEVANKESH